jgi:hypothetical protein
VWCSSDALWVRFCGSCANLDPATLSASSSWHCSKCRERYDSHYMARFYESHPPVSHASPAEVRRLCLDFVNYLMAHDLARDFREPIEGVCFSPKPAAGILMSQSASAAGDYRDYYAVIRHPMDLGTIARYLADETRPFSLSTFVCDIRTTFHNCRVFNEDISAIGR